MQPEGRCLLTYVPRLEPDVHYPTPTERLAYHRHNSNNISFSKRRFYTRAYVITLTLHKTAEPDTAN